jgi:hypothetical protein
MQVGDVVYLKSGSPRLTILDIDDDQAEVGYFHYSTGIFHQIEDVPLTCLTKHPTFKGEP